MNPAQRAVRALVLEAVLSPKPGLVDRVDSGAHKDMDLTHFLHSAAALQPYFSQYYELGQTYRDQPDLLFVHLRSVGKLAEEAMFRATGGINTHKGANFTMALFLAAEGASDSRTPEVLQQTIKRLTQSLCADFRQLDPDRLSHGETLYLIHGYPGLRGEAMAGYPELFATWYPYLMQQQGIWTRRYLSTLLLMMRTCTDTNLLHRGGDEGLSYVQNYATSLSEHWTPDDLMAFNEALKKRNLSPGGSADLLAACAYLDPSDDLPDLDQLLLVSERSLFA